MAVDKKDTSLDERLVCSACREQPWKLDGKCPFCGRPMEVSDYKGHALFKCPHEPCGGSKGFRRHCQKCGGVLWAVQAKREEIKIGIGGVIKPLGDGKILGPSDVIQRIEENIYQLANAIVVLESDSSDSSDDSRDIHEKLEALSQRIQAIEKKE